MPPRSLVVLLFALLPTAIAQRDPATLGATISAQASYSLLPKCINQCLWDQGSNDLNGGRGGDLAENLSCGSPWPNGCYCKGASATFAYSFIKSCATVLCTTPKASDINSGVVVYTNYCSTALGAAYTPAAAPQSVEDGISASVAAPSTSATLRATSSVPKETNPSNQSPNPTSTANSANSNNNSNPNTVDDGKIAGISKAAFIGIIVSCSCSFLGLVFGIWFKFYKHKKQTKMQQQQLATHGYYQTKT
ncbi:hypothetical protein B0J11DRAFT_533271 [Dendryphion nanum]|uniref:Extracellular membrane protein CFEM domain-containing protein n=1 Tax=Dendryphion nanum TaxID=256645 RepID=A0A9P9DLB9_9PLEO|nr:hypothetical protein B0J11DRAFT_533271 [Dendryphion nanum]